MGAQFRFRYHINTDRKVCRCVLICYDTSVDDLWFLDDFIVLVMFVINVPTCHAERMTFIYTVYVC